LHYLNSNPAILAVSCDRLLKSCTKFWPMLWVGFGA
jgi:hypothetical protein